MADDYVAISNSTLLALMTAEDKEIARSIYENKQHLGALAMVELAYMMGKCNGRVGSHPAALKETTNG